MDHVKGCILASEPLIQVVYFKEEVLAMGMSSRNKVTAMKLDVRVLFRHFIDPELSNQRENLRMGQDNLAAEDAPWCIAHHI